MSKVYDIITERILGMLAEGTVPWRKGWNGGSAGRPVSVRGRAYRGINTWLLAAQGYTSPVWLTYKQAVALGGVVKKGEHGTPVTFWKQLEVDDPETGKKKRIPFLRYFTVFNTEQTEGCTFDKATQERIDTALAGVETNEWDPVEHAEAIFESMPNRPSVTFDGGDRAYYRPSTDSVHLPKRETFIGAPNFYETAFHELAHSTGHKSRLDRNLANEDATFGSHPYGREELVAEMTSAFLLAEAGLEAETIENAAAYVASWTKTIREDTKMVVWAASQAQKAADYILGVEAEPFVAGVAE